ncbi:JmjC domain-containing protein 7 [Nowakowskiella sp. JEL0407]|nr:JmjC domain-containing protein 7 [Nowakowskiella sp. JEL0407]
MDSLLERLAEEAREFRGTHVEEIEGTPTAVEFLRYVSLNKPVVFRNAAEGWKCMNWRSYPERIKELMGNNETKVAVTPNGLADSILDDKFVLPFECSMSIDTLFSKFQQNPKSTFDNQPVFYVQSQNNNLHEDFQPLLADASDDIDWASEALGEKFLNLSN